MSIERDGVPLVSDESDSKISVESLKNLFFERESVGATV